MQATSPPVPIPLWRPWPLRAWHAVVGAAHGARAWAQARWQAHCFRAEQRQEWGELDELNAHVLRDIGAPDWMVWQARERTSLAQQRRDEFGAWRGV